MKDAVVLFPPEAVLTGDTPGEFHVFAAGGAVGFGESADFIEEGSLAEEVVGYEGFDRSVEVFSAPDEFVVGKPLDEGVFYGAAVTAAAASDVLFLDDVACFFDPVGGGDDIGIGKEEIVSGGVLGAEVAGGACTGASGGGDALGGGGMRWGVASVEPSSTMMIS